MFMQIKLLIFTVIIAAPGLIYWYFSKDKYDIDKRKLISYFLFGSWFGMCGEVFIDTVINKILHVPVPLWEYRILPIHDKITSSYGPIMWGFAAVCICLYENYSVKTKANMKPVAAFFAESGFLIIAELYFCIAGYFLFDEYFFYYFSPEFLHFSALVNIPLWWCGYKLVVKASEVLYKQEKLNATLAFVMIVIVLWGFGA